MDFFEKTNRLAKEFLLFKKYKAMHPVIAVFVGIFLIPFAISFFVGLGLLYILSILFYLIKAPLDFLHNVVKEERGEVKHATQFWIYFISWGPIFLLYALYAFISFFFYVFYLGVQIDGYITSLGGYKFHISPNEEDISIEVQPTLRFNYAGLIFIAVCVILIISSVVAAITMYSSLYANYEEALFPMKYSPFLYGVVSTYELFSFVFIPIAFKNKKVDTPKEEE